MKIELWFDGACEPRNPGGTGTWGFVIRGLEGPDWELVKDCGALAARPGMTNNFAEYTALGKGLRFLSNYAGITKSDSLTIRGDSKLVVNQLGGLWACNAENLQPLLNRCRELLAGLELSWTAEWIPRDQNEEADALSQQAYEKATGKKFPVRVQK